MNKIWDDLPEDLKRNPFFQFSEETNYVPAWDRIKPEHIMPAMDYALDLNRRNIQKIVDNKAAPTYKNTVEALEQAGELAGYFFGVLFNLMPGGGKAEDEYDRTINQVQRKYGKLYTEIYGENTKLRDRVAAVAKLPAYKKLSREKKFVHEMYTNTFKAAGMDLSPKKKAELRDLSERITDLEFKSMNNMKLAGREFLLVVDDREKLKGLSDFSLAAAAKKAEAAGQPGKWAFGTSTDVYKTFLASVEDRKLRKQMWYGYETQAGHGKYDNRATILELVKLQHRQSQLLGYRHTAAHNISYNMAVETKRVADFLTNLRKAAKPVAQEEMNELQKYARKKDRIKLEPWDVDFYKEQMKRDVLGYDEEQLRPYLELESVLKGCFRHFEKLLGLRYEEVKDYPVYNPEVRAFNVYKKGSDKLAGVVFMDLLARDDKPPGTAWDAGILSPGLFEGKERRPVDMIVTKFAKGEPTLLTHYDFLVLMHEMGHASHNLLSNTRYTSYSGTSVDGDFVEFPSQFEENYTFEPEVLDDIAVHYQTGEKMPDELKQKIKDSLKFMAGTQVLDYASKGWLDLSWYRADPKKLTSVEAFEKAATAQYQLLPRHGALLSPHFSHLFGGGYEANFYSYQWSQIMEADAFAAFAEKGLYDRKLSTAFKRILEHGGTEWPNKLFHEFRHRNPIQKHFLARNGLLSEHFNYAASEGAIPAPLSSILPGVVPAPLSSILGGQSSEDSIRVQAAANGNRPAEDTIDDIFAAPRVPRPGSNLRHRYML